MDSPTTILTSASTQTSLNAITWTTKRKRRPAGTPDPDAEVIALSPKTLMESDRFVCEICNQGFQRDQNLQMHRRRHKVPWKLLKRVDPEVHKRVYVCPEPSCLHHNPCHALGDLVGIKKHYRRKHSSMKQWECDKCSKAYAVQSDYKAHLKTCGTRGHCCDCGRVFSRIESFIEHQDTCTAARNKNFESASTEAEAASLFHVDGQNRTDMFSHQLPVQISASPASAATALTMKAHACIEIPAAAPPPSLSPASPVELPQQFLHHMAKPTHSQATQDDGISWQTQQPRTSHSHLGLKLYKAELQLLPTSKAHLNIQHESSQSSVTWEKDITSGTCSSPASKTVDDKCMREGADCPDTLPMSDAPTTAGAPICQLQLSIGLSNTEYNGKSTSLHVSRDIASQEGKSKQFDSKATSCKSRLVCSPFPFYVNGACHDVANIGVAKRHSNLRSSTDEKQAMTHCIDPYEGATDLELATSFDHRSCSAVWSNQSGVLGKVHQLQQRHGLSLSCSRNLSAEVSAEFSDQNRTKPSHITQDADEIGLLQVMRRSCKQSVESKEAGKSTFWRCNSQGESAVAPDVSTPLQTEQSDSLSGSFKEPDCVSELLQFAETPYLSAEGSVPQKLSLSFKSDMDAPAAVAEVTEVLIQLQEARENLRRASAEKQEAEKAWREARREREQAEEELAKAQRIAEDNRMVARGKGALVRNEEGEGATIRKGTICCTSTSSSPCSSIVNTQAASSFLQMRQQHAGGILCNAPTFITCPNCHHTQIFVPLSS